MIEDEDLKQAEAALRGEVDLDEQVLERLIQTIYAAKATRVETLIEIAAGLNELGVALMQNATLERRTMMQLEVAGLLRGVALVLDSAGANESPCPHCGAGVVHRETCSLGKAVRKWRTMLPGPDPKVRA